MDNGKNATEDVVNHPSHYNQYTGFEVIDVCEQLRAPDGAGNYNRGNAFKYLARAGWKREDKHVEDLEKAKFYIQREIDRIQNNSPSDTKSGLFRCPQCDEVLTGDLSCPEDHGWMKIEGAGDHVWMPPTVSKPFPREERNVHRCPVCKLVLEPSKENAALFFCPSNHGQLDVVYPMTEKGIWISWSLDSSLVCTICKKAMAKLPDDTTTWYCPDGHGSTQRSNK